MQATIESISNLERRLSLTLPADQLEDQVTTRLRDIARTARIKGFRPGRVPLSVVQQRFGVEVRDEITNNLLRQRFDSVVRENNLRLAGGVQVDRPDEKAWEFVVTFEVMPDFGAIEVEQLQVVRHTADVTEEDIDQMIENLQLQRLIAWKDSDAPARRNNQVNVEIWTEVEGERLPAEGVETANTILGSRNLFEEVEEALYGTSVGDEKTIDVTFPAEWRVEKLANRTAQVHVKVTAVLAAEVPEVTQEFIRSFGVKSGELEQFRNDIRSNLERELKGALMTRLRQSVNEQLSEKYAAIEMPPRMVESEARNLLIQQVESIQRQGREVGQLPENAHEGFLEAANKRVLLGLLVREIAIRNELRLDPKRLNETLRLIASTYEQPEEVIAMYRNDEQLMNGLQARVMEEQVIDWVAEHAQKEEKSLTFQQAIRF